MGKSSGSRSDYHREYMRQWIAKRRADWIALNGPCAECGSSDSLQVDHVDPATKLSHRVWSWAAERREGELAKCQVLCEPCHVAKTREENVVHGTASRWDAGCECALCRTVGHERKLAGRAAQRDRDRVAREEAAAERRAAREAQRPKVARPWLAVQRRLREQGKQGCK